MLSRLPPLLLVLLPSQALDTGEQISRLYPGWDQVGGRGGEVGANLAESEWMETLECVASSVNIGQQLKHPVRRCSTLIAAV